MDKVEFNEEFSSLYIAGRDRMPSHRYENMDKVLKAVTYSGNVYIMGEKSKEKMYQDVKDAVRYASSVSCANARMFEKTVDAYLNEIGYDSDCEVEKVIERDYEVGKTLKQVYVKGYPDQEIEK